MSHTPSLFRQSNELAATLAQIAENDGELTPELEEALSLTQQNLATRAEWMLDLRAQTAANVTLAKEKIKQLTDFIKANERIGDNLDNRLLGAIHQFGPIQAGTQKLSLRTSEAVVIDNEQLIGHDLRGAIPLQGAPSKTLIKERLKAGQPVPGARLVTNYNLSIK